MRGELEEVERNLMNYSMARGLFFDDRDAYVVQVQTGGRTDEVGVVLTGAEETIAETVYNQPELHGTGVNESLSMSDQQARLPEDGEDIEAYARYVLQGEVDEGLEYEGSRDLEEIDF